MEPSTPTAGGLPTPVFDRAQALRRLDDSLELFAELIEIFLADVVGQVVEVKEALQQRDAHRLRRLAHSLKGSVGIFAAQAALGACQKVEHLGDDLDGAGPAVAEMIDQVERLKVALEREGKDGGCAGTGC